MNYLKAIHDKVRTVRNIRRVNRMLKNPTAYEWGYSSEEDEVKTAFNYWLERKVLPSEQLILYSEQLKKMRRILSEKDIRRCYDFGCSYAYVFGILAETFTGIEFYAYDRSKLTAQFNKMSFQAVSNISFLWKPLFFPPDLNLLYTSRTLNYLPPNQVIDIYRMAQAKHIVGFERVGYPYKEKPESCGFKAGMVQHNYRKLLYSLGYELVESEIIHPKKNANILYFWGKK